MNFKMTRMCAGSIEKNPLLYSKSRINPARKVGRMPSGEGICSWWYGELR